MRTYTFIRKDLSLRQQIVQACHSALQAGAEFLDKDLTPYLIVLQVEDELELNLVAIMLDENGIKYHKFFEPDNNIGHSSITTESLTKEKSLLLKDFKTWNGE